MAGQRKMRGASMAQDGATTGQALIWNGSTWTPTTVSSTPSVITPSQITSNQNDYSPTGWSTADVIRVSGDSSFRKITGLAAWTAGRTKTIINAGSYCLLFSPEHTSSTAANRLSHYEEVILPPGGTLVLMYDSTLSRAVVVSNTAANYKIHRRAVWYEKYGSKYPEGITEDTVLQYSGSGNVGTTSPTSTFPFVRWSMDNNSLATGDKVLYMLKTADALSYAGSAHIATKVEFNSLSVLSDASQQYRIRFVLTASPASLLTNVNNTVGIRYSHDINSGKWQCYCRDSGGTETTADSGVTYAVDTIYSIAISLDIALAEATFFINGAVVGRITANLPSAVAVGAGIQYGKLVGTTNYTFNGHYLMAAAIMA